MDYYFISQNLKILSDATLGYSYYLFSYYPGRVDNLSFFEYLSPFCFMLIEFHCTFSISYKILPYYVYYYCILVRM